MDKEKNYKLYYSIGEVSGMLHVSQSLLRYWEKEFPQISPRTNKRGVRQYRKEDLDTIRLIHHLVKDCGLTLAGARQRLKSQKEYTEQRFDIISRLKEIKEELLAIKQELD